jgi:hypothetical protein
VTFSPHSLCLFDDWAGATVEVLRARDAGEFNAYDVAGLDAYRVIDSMMVKPAAAITLLVCDLRDSRPIKVSQMRFW